MDKAMTDAEIDERLAEFMGGFVSETRDIDGNRLFFTVATGDEFSPRTSISDAFQVFEKMRELGWWFMVQSPRKVNEGGTWGVVFNRAGKLESCDRSETPCRAICLAAIAAIGEQK